ncbi:dolichyl pyrophosphate Glc1Man9GlcNAc2 alpha-1,3-glucosyltransferase [Verticillium alfalfae VaMs.102]|uniref:Alpha-1,3-glucosyltransferase n=1 Tax=Verticillium alfalfae (strain VaMs.102 / ATCC MYA-4576 / FGSC 10136) TaxID=526221 RepID=C9SEV3_VERA1|nr:dolichyl pyrophosphate Glc1Man9GlcNAc2 alpha-1,3-glucosyltransferase [Verticillium alfalfae VaMs.102]EEY16696.1 dolichyl pyrophosphate Glc1Man9GlcNAc2 alpha-1,3-glucosyltransferase [Verticillium alfalfae VaMs.102]
MADHFPTITQCALVAAAFKVLLFPAYKSTDFEVHRNWLAITESLPISQWYLEKTSEWTLDYPPFFAYFEWALSQVAKLVDPSMTKLYNLEYDSWQTIYFQRWSVIISEIVLVFALHMFIDSASPSNRRATQTAALSILLSPGLLIIDHIHFQYNGCMYGILIISLVLARSKSTLLSSGLVFAALLCMKHIYLYLAPAYFVFLLRAYCLSPRSIYTIRFFNCVKLGLGIGAIFGAAFGPFVYLQQIPQLLSRLFPFSRGLCHAYWAPNIWALYSFADRALRRPTWGELSGRSDTLKIKRQKYSAGTSTKRPTLLIIIPFSLIALQDRRYIGAFRPLAVAGHVSLFPLLFTPAEFPIKTVYTIFWLILFLMVFDRLAPPSRKARFFLLDRFSTLYIAVSIPLIVYCSLVHQVVFGKR